MSDTETKLFIIDKVIELVEKARLSGGDAEGMICFAVASTMLRDVDSHVQGYSIDHTNDLSEYLSTARYHLGAMVGLMPSHGLSVDASSRKAIEALEQAKLNLRVV
jgi:hypothetical protein